jgi:hypothetical protein
MIPMTQQDFFKEYYNNSPFKEATIIRFTRDFIHMEGKFFSINIYDFICSDKYNFRKVFDESDEFQKSFWCYMEINGYAVFDENYGENGCWLIKELNTDAFFRPTDIAIVGYLISYIRCY